MGPTRPLVAGEPAPHCYYSVSSVVLGGRGSTRWVVDDRGAAGARGAGQRFARGPRGARPRGSGVRAPSTHAFVGSSAPNPGRRARGGGRPGGLPGDLDRRRTDPAGIGHRVGPAGRVGPRPPPRVRGHLAGGAELHRARGRRRRRGGLAPAPAGRGAGRDLRGSRGGARLEGRRRPVDPESLGPDAVRGRGVARRAERAPRRRPVRSHPRRSVRWCPTRSRTRGSGRPWRRWAAAR